MYNKQYSNPRNLLCITFLIGMISTQRFSMPEISANICLLSIPLLLSTKFRNSYFSILIISLLTSVDLGAEIYEETISYFRYFIYILVVIYAIEKKLIKSHTIIFVVWVFVLIIFTLINKTPIDIYTLFRDVLTLLLIFIALSFKKEKKYLEETTQILVSLSLGMMIGELINMIFFYNIFSENYLSYSSLKYFVVISPIYFLIYKKYYFALILFLLCNFILLGFSSRMLLLTFNLIFIVVLIKNYFLSKYKYMFSLSIIFCTLLLKFIIYDKMDFDISRSFYIFTLLNENNNITDVIASLDPVRYAENSIFFNQNLFQLLFGNGIGIGIYDQHGLISSVVKDETAFSYEELSSGIFYRLHDSWIWFGLRFGLITYFLLFIYIIKIILNHKNCSASFYGAFLFMTLLNASFSISGLLLCFAIISTLIKYSNAIVEEI